MKYKLKPTSAPTSGFPFRYSAYDEKDVFVAAEASAISWDDAKKKLIKTLIDRDTPPSPETYETPNVTIY